MKQNTKGSILVTAIVIIMIIMILLGAALTIASSYYTSSVNENTKKQVYLSAKSGADLIVHYVQSGTKKVIPDVGDTMRISEMSVEDDPVTKKGYVKRIDEDTIKIVIDASFDDYTYKMQVDMKLTSLQWMTKSYCEAKEGDTLC